MFLVNSAAGLDGGQKRIFPPPNGARQPMKLKDRNGILLPAKMKVGSWIVVGPPCSG